MKQVRLEALKLAVLTPDVQDVVKTAGEYLDFIETGEAPKRTLKLKDVIPLLKGKSNGKK